MKVKSFFSLLLVLVLYFHSFAQNIFSCLVRNAATGEPLSNVSILTGGGEPNTVTNNNGEARMLIQRGSGQFVFQFSRSGFTYQTLAVSFPLANPDTVFSILMEPDDKESTIIYSYRTDSKFANTVGNVEVIENNKLEKGMAVKPSHIGRLLNHVAGMQTQMMSAVSNNTNLRIQGLPGKYTQILRDGMPLFGGFAASYGQLDIPPLDVQQIEIIKNASSVLYGGGALSGLINIISKKPSTIAPERILLLNQSTLQGSDLNIYLSERKGKVGYTFFVGARYQKQKDINNDYFSDVARQEAIFLHPTFYFYLNEKNTVSLSINSAYDDRTGGDMDILSGYFSNMHQFFIQNQALRNTLGIDWEKKVTSGETYHFKIGTSSFNRDISSNVFGMKAKQFSYYAEGSYVKKIAKHDLAVSINLNGENLKKGLPDSTLINSYQYFTPGLLIQDDWRVHPKFTIETALRSDFHNQYGTFILPAVSLLYKMNSEISLRMGGGMGYQIPTVFASEVDEREYPKLQPLQNVKAEKSISLTWDFNYKKKMGQVDMAFNQSFFLTQIKRPLVVQKTSSSISFYNETKPISTSGSETSFQVAYAGLAANFSYTITQAKKKYDPVHPYLELSARNYLLGTLSYSFPKYVRIAIETTQTGRQYLEDGSQTPLFSQFGGMIQFDVGRLSFVLNCDNYYDYRQTKKESIVIPPYLNPTFKQLWAPIDGRVANLSIRVRL